MAEDKLVNCAIECITEIKSLRNENLQLKKQNTILKEKLKEKNKQTENEMMNRGKIIKLPVKDEMLMSYREVYRQRTFKTEPIGLAVICCHTRFDSNRQLAREGGEKDEHLKETLEAYGFKVVLYRNKTTSFYEKDLIRHIEYELNDLPFIKLFAFVLSTHGEEKQEVILHGGPKGKTFDHYFCTFDAEFKTQDLMANIAAIGRLKTKLKFFVIQTCRSRSVEDATDGYDIGYHPKDRATTIIDYCSMDAKGKTCDTKAEPPESDTKAEPPESDTNAEPPKVDTKSESPKGDTKSEPSDITVLIPHCDDCIVLFASMPGKYAYRFRDGSLVIQQLIKTLDENQTGGRINILDLLRRINCEVGKKTIPIEMEGQTVAVKSQSCFVHNITFEVNDLVLVKIR